MVAALLGATSNCTINGEAADCGAAAGIALAVLIPFIIIAILSFVGWLVMLIHAITKDIPNKAVWIVLLLLFNVAWIIYYFVVKRPFDNGTLPPASGTPGATPPAPGSPTPAA